MYFPPVSNDPAEQQRANEAAAKVVTWLAGAGGIVAGFIMAVFFNFGPSILGFMFCSIVLLLSVPAWPREWERAMYWHVTYAVGWLGWVICLGLLIT